MQCGHILIKKSFEIHNGTSGELRITIQLKEQVLDSAGTLTYLNGTFHLYFGSKCFHCLPSPKTFHNRLLSPGMQLLCLQITMKLRCIILMGFTF